MEVKAQAKDIRISPRKTRLVASLIRGMKAVRAVDQLNFSNKKASLPMRKLLQSAIANAKNNYELDENNLLIKEVKVDEGRTLRRWLPRAHGRATILRKRMSHISMTLAEINDSGKKESVKQVIEKPVSLDKLAEEAQKSAKKGEEKAGKKGEKAEQKRAEKGFAGKVFRRKAG